MSEEYLVASPLYSPKLIPGRMGWVYNWPIPPVLAPTPPAPPSPYTLPMGGTLVTNTAELLAAWGGGVATDIILADGEYDNAGPLPNSNVPHRLWAEHLLGATLRMGLSWGNNTTGSAGELHGIAFNVDDLAKVSALGTALKAIVLTWMGPLFTFEGGLKVEDCTFDMNSVIGSAIQATSPQGLVINRCQISHGIDWGILAFRNNLPGDALSIPMRIADIDIDGILYPVKDPDNGGQGIWAGHKAEIKRIRIRNVDWSGLSLVNDATDVTIEDVDADDCQQGYLDPGGRGIYLEQCHNVTIDRLYVGPRSMFGISAEWNLGNANPYLNDWVPRNYNIWVRNADINSYKVGISWDMTVQRCQIAYSRFSRSWRAAILDNNQFLGPPLIQSTNSSDLHACEFQMAYGVPPILHAHHLGYITPPPPGWPPTPAEYNNRRLGVREQRFVEASRAIPNPGP